MSRDSLRPELAFKRTSSLLDPEAHFQSFFQTKTKVSKVDGIGKLFQIMINSTRKNVIMSQSVRPCTKAQDTKTWEDFFNWKLQPLLY